MLSFKVYWEIKNRSFSLKKQFITIERLWEKAGTGKSRFGFRAVAWWAQQDWSELPSKQKKILMPKIQKGSSTTFKICNLWTSTRWWWSSAWSEASIPVSDTSGMRYFRYAILPVSDTSGIRYSGYPEPHLWTLSHCVSSFLCSEIVIKKSRRGSWFEKQRSVVRVSPEVAWFAGVNLCVSELPSVHLATNCWKRWENKLKRAPFI